LQPQDLGGGQFLIPLPPPFFLPTNSSCPRSPQKPRYFPFATCPLLCYATFSFFRLALPPPVKSVVWDHCVLSGQRSGWWPRLLWGVGVVGFVLPSCSVWGVPFLWCGLFWGVGWVVRAPSVSQDCLFTLPKDFHPDCCSSNLC